MADARLTALRGLSEVFGQGGYSNLVLESLMRKNELTGQERAFCTALFYGVVERRITLDWVLGRYSRQPVEKLSPAVRDILRMAVYQLLYMPSIPERAAVNEAVKETRAMRVSSASGYVNGVLRAFLRDGKKIALPREPLAALSVQYAVPKALITLWRQGYGEETTRAILEGCQSPAPLFIRVNSQKTTAEALMEKLAEENITAGKTPVENALQLEGAGDVTRLAAFREGLFHVQDLSSQKCAAALAVQPGHRVLDVCSAPGGKTFTLAERMEDTGSLLAMDLYPHRLKLVEDGAARLGLRCIQTKSNDAQIYDKSLGVFDRILCDVVCSGYGVIRRKPEIRYKDPAEGVALPQTQLAILTTSARYLAPGGRLVYSTCTFSPEENEQTVEAFLQAHPEFSLSGIHRLYPHTSAGEGQFAAVLHRGGIGTARTEAPNGRPVREWEAFCRDAMAYAPRQVVRLLPDGRVFLLPDRIPPAMDRLRVLNAGVLAGEIKNGRFQPAHALFLAYERTAFQSAVELDGAALSAYLAGEAIPCAVGGSGFAAVCAQGYPIGFGKLTGGMLKNHLPKGLRMR